MRLVLFRFDDKVYNMVNSKNTRFTNTALRRVQSQSNDRSCSITIPKFFARILNIKKGDYVKISHDGSKLIFEKVISDLNFLNDCDDQQLSKRLQCIKALITEIAVYKNPNIEIPVTKSDVALTECTSKDEFISKYFPDIFDQLELEFDIDREEIESCLKGKIA